MKSKIKEKFETVEVEFTDELFMKISLLAHENDITFNQMCNILLKNYIEEEEKKVKKVQKLVKSKN